MHVSKGDWVKYRHPRGWTSEGKVLEKRPDGILVVGQHDNDPNPSHVEPDDLTGKIE